MTWITFVVAAFAVMKSLDWLEGFVPESWSRVFRPQFKNSLAVIFSATLAQYGMGLHPRTWGLVMAGLGVAGLASVLHQIHRVLSARADDCQQQVILRHQATARRR